MIMTNVSPPPAIYSPPQVCPGCWGGNWLIGRHFAECARCGAALPLSCTERPVRVTMGGRR